MRLKTYPRLNLPTKRLGVDVNDWLWIGLSMLPGLLLQSIFISIASAIGVGVWCAYFKAKKPRGWFSSFLEFNVKNSFGLRSLIYEARLQRKLEKK